LSESEGKLRTALSEKTMEASLAKFETSRVRLELQTITSKLETEQKRCELLEREKANIHKELNDTRVKLEHM
jgi:chromosome segregation ATPase